MTILHNIIIVLICCFFALQTQAQKATASTFSEQAFIDSVTSIGQNTKTGVAVLGDFEAGVARTKLGDKYGLINSEGDEICPPIYDAVRVYKNGYAAVKKDNKWMMVNKQGMLLTAKA